MQKSEDNKETRICEILANKMPRNEVDGGVFVQGKRVKKFREIKRRTKYMTNLLETREKFENRFLPNFT